MSEVIVIGSGFAGLWAALGAARRLDELAVPPGQVTITVLSALPYHDIRVRNYEADLSACRIPLSAVLDPAGIRHIAATVTAIDPVAHTVTSEAGPTATTAWCSRRAAGSPGLASRACASTASTSTPMTPQGNSMRT